MNKPPRRASSDALGRPLLIGPDELEREEEVRNTLTAERCREVERVLDDFEIGRETWAGQLARMCARISTGWEPLVRPLQQLADDKKIKTKATSYDSRSKQCRRALTLLEDCGILTCRKVKRRGRKTLLEIKFNVAAIKGQESFPVRVEPEVRQRHDDRQGFTAGTRVQSDATPDTTPDTEPDTTPDTTPDTRPDFDRTPNRTLTGHNTGLSQNHSLLSSLTNPNPKEPTPTSPSVATIEVGEEEEMEVSLIEESSIDVEATPTESVDDEWKAIRRELYRFRVRENRVAIRKAIEHGLKPPYVQALIKDARRCDTPPAVLYQWITGDREPMQTQEEFEEEQREAAERREWKRRTEADAMRGRVQNEGERRGWTAEATLAAVFKQLRDNGLETEASDEEREAWEQWDQVRHEQVREQENHEREQDRQRANFIAEPTDSKNVSSASELTASSKSRRSWSPESAPKAALKKSYCENARDVDQRRKQIEQLAADEAAAEVAVGGGSIAEAATDRKAEVEKLGREAENGEDVQ